MLTYDWTKNGGQVNPITTFWREMMFLSVRKAGKAEATRFICKRPYRRVVEPDGNVGFVRKPNGNPRLPRDEARLITLEHDHE